MSGGYPGHLLVPMESKKKKQKTLGRFFGAAFGSPNEVVDLSSSSSKPKTISCALSSCKRKFATVSNMRQHCLMAGGAHIEALDKARKSKHRSPWDAIGSYARAVMERFLEWRDRNAAPDDADSDGEG